MLCASFLEGLHFLATPTNCNNQQSYLLQICAAANFIRECADLVAAIFRLSSLPDFPLTTSQNGFFLNDVMLHTQIRI